MAQKPSGGDKAVQEELMNPLETQHEYRCALYYGTVATATQKLIELVGLFLTTSVPPILLLS